MSQPRSAQQIEKSYLIAKELYDSIGVSTDQAIELLNRIPISLHVWQGDDVSGFENSSTELGGGLAVTGNYPGKASNVEELRSDLDLTYGLIPGNHRLALHAIYGEFGGRAVDRDGIKPEHFTGWVDWAKEKKHGLDFNPTLFAHPKASDGFTLSSYDERIRNFWVDHCIASRYIGEYLGKEMNDPCINNIWIPDGYKDTPIDRKSPRDLLVDSLDRILSSPVNKEWNKDAVEGKLFGIGAESYTTGSHEFYLGYAVKNQILLCLDSGHYHPTETITDKISAVLEFVPEILLHVSRGVRWDSDHVVTLNEDLQAISQEIIRNNYTDRVHIGLDYFDASINRIAAWAIGSRNTLKALLYALLEPSNEIKSAEIQGDYTKRLVYLEEQKSLPFGLVWDYYCLSKDVPVGKSFLDKIRNYEKTVLMRREG